MRKKSELDILIVDDHLDLAKDVSLFGRNLTRDLSQISAQEDRTHHQAAILQPPTNLVL
jgi:hypothetical protein